MKLLPALLVVVCACGPSSKGSGGGGTTTTSSSSSVTTASSGAPNRTPATPQQSLSTWHQQASTSKSSYSCFQYTTDKRRSACTRSDDCPPYLEQIKSVSGVRDVTGCATVPQVHCFHQPPSAEEPDGQEVCQPTLAECTASRTDVIKAKMSVDSECQQR
jgi:hypothetical protein